MSRAFRVTIDFVEISHSELPAGKFEVRVTSDGIYLRATAARRWRFLSWEDAAISASWSEAPRSRAVSDELTEASEETSDAAQAGFDVRDVAANALLPESLRGMMAAKVLDAIAASTDRE